MKFFKETPEVAAVEEDKKK